VQNEQWLILQKRAVFNDILRNEDVLPAIPEVDSMQADMNLVIVNKLDSLIKMADEQKKAEVEMRQDISQLKENRRIL